jgi:hypothetical protein
LNNKPADATRHMLNFTRVKCVVCKKQMLGSNKEIWGCGNCLDCIKNLGYECQVATTKVCNKEGILQNYSLCHLMLSQVEPSECASGPQDTQGLRGLGPGKNPIVKRITINSKIFALTLVLRNGIRIAKESS